MLKMSSATLFIGRRMAVASRKRNGERSNGRPVAAMRIVEASTRTAPALSKSPAVGGRINIVGSRSHRRSDDGQETDAGTVLW